MGFCQNFARYKYTKNYLQPALLVKDIGQPGNAVQSRRLLACRGQSDVICQVELGLGVLAGLKVEKQVILDRKHSVVGDPLVVAGV